MTIQFFQSDDHTDSLSNNSCRRDSSVSTSTSNDNSQINLEGLAEGLPPGWSIQRAPNGLFIQCLPQYNHDKFLRENCFSCLVK